MIEIELELAVLGSENVNLWSSFCINIELQPFSLVGNNLDLSMMSLQEISDQIHKCFFMCFMMPGQVVLD